MEKETIEEKETEKVEETAKKEKKTNIKEVIIIGILSIVILALLFVIIDIKFISKESKEDKTPTEEQKDNNNQKEETGKKEETKYENISLEDSLVTEAYSLVPRGICGHAGFELANKNRKLSDLSSKEKMEMIENHYRYQIPLSNTDEKIYISNEELKKYFEDTSFVTDYIENYPNKGVGLADEILYSDGKLSLKHLYGVGCEGPSQGTMAKLYSAKKADNRLALNIIIFTQEVLRDEMGEDGHYHFVFSIFRDSDQKEKGYEGYFDSETKISEVLDSNFFYGYQFVFDTSNGNMRIIEIKYLDHLSDGL